MGKITGPDRTFKHYYLAPGSQFLCPFMLSVAVLAVPGSRLRLAWVSGFWHLGLGTGS